MKNTFTPKIGIMVIVLVLILSAVLMVSKQNESATINSSASGSPKTNSTLAANAEKEGDVGDYYDGTKSASAKVSPTPVPTPVDIKQYVYPKSITKVSTKIKLEMESDESAEKITEWYKNKIATLNFNAKSFAQTTTNGEVLNKLTAAKPGEKIDITIKKDQSTSKVLITVDRS